MTFWTFGESMYYIHSRIHVISYYAIKTSQISLYICSSSHTRKHRHTNTSSTINHTSRCYACSFFCHYFFACKLQPRDLFLMPGATTHWSYTWSTQWGSNPKGSFSTQELQLVGVRSYNSLTCFWGSNLLVSTHEAPTPRDRSLSKRLQP